LRADDARCAHVGRQHEGDDEEVGNDESCRDDDGQRREV
jgi:hypothetical protein